MRIYIDDEREVPEDYDIRVKTYWGFAEWMAIEGYQNRVLKMSHFSFDHDLGEEMTGLDCLKLLARYDKERKCTVSCHSANPVGKENILSFARCNGFTVIQ